MKFNLPRPLKRLFNTAEESTPIEKSSPLFITGCMRSGTTFLVDKLSAHPQLFKIGVELNTAWEKIGGTSTSEYCEYNDGTHASPYHTYQMSCHISDFIQNGKSLKRHLMRWVNLRNKQTGRVFYDWDHLIPMNKSPHLINKISYVRALFPKSKIILIVRDIYSHSASQKIHFDQDYKSRKKVSIETDLEGYCWSRVYENQIPSELSDFPRYPGDFSTIPRMWIRLNKVAFKSLESLSDDDYLVIKYEDLILHQEAILKRVFQFLDLKDEFKEVESKIATKKIALINTTSSGDPLEKWRKQLNDEEIADIQSSIETQSQDYQYILDQLEKSKLKF